MVDEVSQAGEELSAVAADQDIWAACNKAKGLFRLISSCLLFFKILICLSSVHRRLDFVSPLNISAGWWW